MKNAFKADKMIFSLPKNNPLQKNPNLQLENLGPELQKLAATTTRNKNKDFMTPNTQIR